MHWEISLQTVHAQSVAVEAMAWPRCLVVAVAGAHHGDVAARLANLAVVVVAVAYLEFLQTLFHPLLAEGVVVVAVEVGMWLMEQSSRLPPSASTPPSEILPS